MALFNKRPELIVPRDGEFLVSGVTHRQEALRKAGIGAHMFRMVRDTANPYDEWAVAVYVDKTHIGFVSRNVSRSWAKALDRHEGQTVLVYGEIIRKQDGGLIAQIDALFPDDIP